MRRLHRAAAAAAALLATGWPAVVSGAVAPLSGARVSLTAQQRPVGLFLSELLAPSGVPVSISPGVTGAVSGVFEGTVAQVYQRVAHAFGLRSYFDGRQIYIYSASETRAARVPSAGGGPAALAARVSRAGLPDPDDRVQLEGDHLLATGAPRFIEQVTALATETAPGGTVVARRRAPVARTVVRVEDGGPQYRVFRLQYAWAADMQLTAAGAPIQVPGLASILRALVGGEGGPGAVAASPPAPAAPGAPVGRASEWRQDAVGRDNSLGAGLADLFGLARSTSERQSPAPASAPPAAAPATRIVHPSDAPPRIEADPRLNAVIIRDTPARLAQYEGLIRVLDCEPRIVEIVAEIIDVDMERLNESGLSFDLRGSDGDEISLNPVAPGEIGSPDQGLHISAVVGGRDRLMMTLRALQSRGIARVTSRPVVVTLSDVPAAFQNNQTFFVPVAGSLSTELYNVAAGTLLKVTPHVSQDVGVARIRLLVDVEDGAISSQQVGALPVVERSALNTESILLDGQSLLVGGMVVQSSTDSDSKIPVLGDIPLAGRLFKASHHDVRHVERLFLITPRLRAAGTSVPTPGSAAPPSSDQPPDQGAAR